MIAEVRPRCPELNAVVLLGSPEWHALLDAGHRWTADRLVPADLPGSAEPAGV